MSCLDGTLVAFLRTRFLSGVVIRLATCTVKQSRALSITKSPRETLFPRPAEVHASSQTACGIPP